MTVPGELGPRGSFRLHMWKMPCMCTSIWASTKFHFTKPATSPWYYYTFVTADLGRGDLSVLWGLSRSRVGVENSTPHFADLWEWPCSSLGLRGCL